MCERGNTCDTYAAEIIPSTLAFIKSVSEIAHKLFVQDYGLFPLCHGDFGHDNIIVDDEYCILGVIDWETSFADPGKCLKISP